MIFTALGVLLMTFVTSIVSLVGFISAPLDFVINPLNTVINFSYHAFTIIAILVHPAFLFSSIALGSFLFFFDVTWWSTKFSNALLKLFPFLKHIFD